MRSRRVVLRLAPYVLTVGLLGSTLAWQGSPARWFGSDAATAPKVVVANYDVPATEAGSAPAPAATDPAPAPAAPAPAAAPTRSPDGGYVIAELPQQTVTPFSLVGVTWASGMPQTAEIEVQWHGKAGWSAWTDLHQDLVPAEDGPGRPGTEPQWVDWADGIAVRVTSAAPATPVDLQVAAVTGSQASDIAPMAATQPGIIMRAQWGARAPGNCADPQYGPSTQGAVIHHTAGKNSYTAAESAGIVRAIQAYHMDSRNWCDIGYNFLVDRYGQIFEGRGGGIDRPVRAAHSGNAAVNEQTTGVSLMGTFSNEDATPEMKAATTQLVAWKFAISGIPAKGQVAIGGKVLERISGHRDVLSTDCPGQFVYNWIQAPGGLRDQVEQILASGPPAAAPPPAAQPAPPPAPTPVVQTVAPAPPPPPPAPPAPLTIPTGLKAAKRAPNSLKFVWNGVPGARYEVRVSRLKSMAYPKVQGSTDTDERLKVKARNQTYYAQVRALRPGGSEKTGWSPVIKTSTKA
ncbi:MAG: peptidoglycan recognition protein [Aeromicrobium sp.]